MDLFQCIKDFFNNQSVGAFIGAFSAFVLVVLTDRRRDRRKVKNLGAEIQMSLAHAKSKLETVRSNRALMREHNQVMAARILTFNTALIRQLTAEILERLSLPQRRAIDVLCYTMEASDEILEEMFNLAKAFERPLGQADRIVIAERLLIEYGDAIVNLNRLVEMCENYIVGKYETIVSKQYDRVKYEEK